MSRVLVLGGANTDIIGVPAAGLTVGDSNPGSVRFSFGGVARNIAENLARLGVQVELVTALGDDHAARMLAAHCLDAGIGIGRSLTLPDTSGSVYLAVLDDRGDLAVAVSDMRALDTLTPPVLQQALAGIPIPDALVLDTNLSPEAIAWLCERFPDVPVFVDCVSVAKAPRLLGSLARVHTVHVNSAEAVELTGAGKGHPDGAARAADRLHRLGVRQVFITEGPRGVFYSSAGEQGRIGALPVEVVDVTGAGDAFMAGAVWGTLQGMPPSVAARMGVAAASITLESASTVAREIGAGPVLALAEEIPG